MDHWSHEHNYILVSSLILFIASDSDASFLDLHDQSHDQDEAR